MYARTWIKRNGKNLPSRVSPRFGKSGSSRVYAYTDIRGGMLYAIVTDIERRIERDVRKERRVTSGTCHPIFKVTSLTQDIRQLSRNAVS